MKHQAAVALRLALSMLVLLSAGGMSSSMAADVAEAASSCVDRAASPDASRREFDRLPQVQYECVRVGGGLHVWVGQAGRPGAQPVLLIHGLGNNAHRDWRATVPALAEQFRVVVLDLPGFGASQALPQGYSFAGLDTLLLEVAERLSLKRFHLVGHSMGGALSLYFAHRHPQFIDRLVLVDAGGVLLKPVFVRHLLEANASSAGMGSLSDVLGMFGGEGGLMDLLEDQSGLSRMLLENAAVRSALFGMEGQADAALGLVEHDFTAAIRETSAPTTVIWGAGDTVTPLRTGKLLAARMPQATLQVMPGAQHMPMNQQPAAFNRLLLQSLSQPTTRSQGGIAPTPGDDVTCVNRPNMRYSGTYRRISLENCANARIENAQIGELSVQHSSVVLENVKVIAAAKTALVARSSKVVATAVELSGSTAISSEDSMLDLAGSSVRGQERGIQALRSRIYFSVSDLQSPEYSGPIHLAWPATGVPVAAKLP